MALITFISDFGRIDPYVAMVKAKIYNLDAAVRIEDISHDIDPFNLAQAAFVLKNVYSIFPKGTVHLIGLNSTSAQSYNLVAVMIQDHFFVGLDNGIFSLIADLDPVIAVKIGQIEEHRFAQIGVLAEISVKLAQGQKIESLGESIDILKMLDRQLRLTKNQITATVIYTDRFGNLITNLKEEVFHRFRKDRDFIISFGREQVTTLFDDYNAQEPGEILARFNSLGYLEIAVNQGNASELLGLTVENPVLVSFKPEIV